MVPSSAANSSLLGPDFPPAAIMNDDWRMLVATPVGAEVPIPPGAGIVTVSGDDAGSCWPLASKLSAVPLWFSATHRPLLRPSAMPQGLSRFGFVVWAIPGT